MSSATDFVKGLGELAKALTGYFNPSAYEARVLRGLVKTGSKMREWSSRVLDETQNGGAVSKETRKKLRHYCRKWKADRSKLT